LSVRIGLQFMDMRFWPYDPKMNESLSYPTVLSEAEKLALYGLPVFDDFQRTEFFAMTEAERDLAFQRQGLIEQVYCLVQLGYFKAKQAFFRFSLEDVPSEDIDFLLVRYFPGQTLTMRQLRDYEYYAQRKEIADLFGYWSAFAFSSVRSPKSKSA
jgi:Domain of unknown function (DUF4158)